MWQPGKTLDDVEKEIILQAYRFYGNNKTKTAASLGISIRTLDSRLARYSEEDKKGVEIGNAHGTERSEPERGIEVSSDFAPQVAVSEEEEC